MRKFQHSRKSFSIGRKRGRIALFLLGYHVVLAVKALRCSRRKAPLRSSTESASPSLDRCAATWIPPAPGNSARQRPERNHDDFYHLADR
jgi:hypothetical protein